MAYQTVFVPMAFESGAASLVSAGIALAKQFGAHLIAHHIRQRFPAYPPLDFFPSAGGLMPIAAESHDEASATFARSLRGVFEQCCDAADVRIVPLSEAPRQNGLTASWCDETGFPISGYAYAARVSDMMVTTTPNQVNRPLEREILESVLIHSGVPVVSVPRDTALSPLRSPMIAWDGSLQAARALRDARPLLQDSAQVTLITIGEHDAGTPSIQEAKLWLQRTGVEVNAKTIERGDESIAATLLKQLAITKSDVLVLGGYSNPRIQETLFGGVTMDLLTKSTVPLFMVH